MIKLPDLKPLKKMKSSKGNTDKLLLAVSTVGCCFNKGTPVALQRKRNA